MLSSCKTCIISLVRERALLWGTLLFPLVLCLLFIAVFSGLNGAYADVTTRLGIVEDDHYAAAPGLSKTMDAISEENADPRIATITGFEDEDAAIEAADVVLMTDEPRKIATAIDIARKTMRIAWQNIVFAIGIKGIVLVLGALGYAGLWAAIFADVGVTVLAIFNAMRALSVKE